MLNKNISNILLETDIEKIKKVLRENEKDSYNFLIDHFCFLPSEYCSDRNEINKNPVKAVNSIVKDVDGSLGMKTSCTPKAVITLYKLLWDNVLKAEEPVQLKGRKPFNGVENLGYEMKWKAGINGRVSGDVLNSFPKKATIDIFYPNLQENNFNLKLFARLCYTLGNFMPVPCLGRGKKSMNSLHSYFKYGKGYYERFDYFIFDILNYTNSKYRKNFFDFGKYINTDFVASNYLEDYIVGNDAYDMGKDTGVFKDINELTMVSQENINTYIENVNARIIARGNRMLIKLKNYNLSQDIMQMYTNDNK